MEDEMSGRAYNVRLPLICVGFSGVQSYGECWVHASNHGRSVK